MPNTLQHARAAYESGAFDQAALLCVQAMKEQASSPSAALFSLLGMASYQLDQYPQAMKFLGMAVQMEPENAAWLCNLGEVLRATGSRQEAVACFDQILTKNPAHTAAHRGKSMALMHGDDKKAAHTALEAWCKADPENPDAKHMLESFSGTHKEAADPIYVKTLFDNFADQFDNHLVGRLDYKTPQLLVEMIGTSTHLSILDAGCGTGLAAPLLKPMAKRLEGIDLSPKMVQKAEKTACYDACYAADLVDFMEKEPQVWDLIFAADVFVYIGNLTPTFQAAATALKKGGRFVFSVENAQETEAPEGYHLRPSGRFAHTRAYIDTLATTHGFEVSSFQEAPLRKEGQHTINGLLFALIWKGGNL